MKRIVSVFLFSLLIASVGAWAQEKTPGNVVSLFQKKCAVCHRGKTPPKGLSWESAQIAAAIDRPSREAPDLKIIDTAAPEASYALKKVRGEAGIKGSRMPPGTALKADEIKILETWILGLKKSPLPASAAGSTGDPGP